MSGPPEPPAPPRELFIYYLRGRLRTEPLRMPPGFLGNWEEGDDSFLFFDRPARRAVTRLLDMQPQVELLDETAMAYEQWQGGPISSLRVAGFCIQPPWSAAAQGEQGVIWLDPGVVFGNGLHPTTRDCLEAIAAACGRHPPSRVLDLGTGTGVLALAAATAGAARVLAVDLNPLCARTTRANIRHNRLEARVLAVQGRAEDFAPLPADLMVANLHYDVLRHLLTAGILGSKRQIVLSGLLRSEAREVIAQLTHLPVTIRRQWSRDDIWHTLYLHGRATGG